MSEEKEKELTPKEERFCQNYVLHLNGAKAARDAGYNEKRARQIASKLRTKHYIKARINELQADIAKTLGVTAIRAAKELRDVAFGSLADLKKNWLKYRNWNDLTKEDKAIISEIKFDGANICVKTHDKLKALAMLNEMLGFNNIEDNTFQGTININIGDIPDDKKLPSQEGDIHDFTEEE